MVVNAKIRATTSLKSNMRCHTAPDTIINQDKLLYVVWYIIIIVGRFRPGPVLCM